MSSWLILGLISFYYIWTQAMNHQAIFSLAPSSRGLWALPELSGELQVDREVHQLHLVSSQIKAGSEICFGSDEELKNEDSIIFSFYFTKKVFVLQPLKNADHSTKSLCPINTDNHVPSKGLNAGRWILSEKEPEWIFDDPNIRSRLSKAKHRSYLERPKQNYLVRKKKLKANNIGKCIACVLIYHAFNYKRKQLPFRGTVAITWKNKLTTEND